MSGSSTAAAESSTTKTTMLAISMAAPAPHLLPRLSLANSLSVFPPDTLRPLGPMSSGQRPKLSLQTSGLTPTFNTSTSNRNNVNLNATATPTTLNTFTNAFELTLRPSPVSTIPSPATQLQRRPTGQPPSPAVNSSDQPYGLNLPFGIQPILKNSPLPRDVCRPSTCSTQSSPRISSRRVFFPAPKRVTFRAILEDEIVTRDYVKCHADLSSSDEEAGSSDSASTEEGAEEAEDRAIRVDECSTRGRRKRKSITVSDLSTAGDSRGREQRSRSTSVRRTKRKKRRWEWTIETGAPGKGPDERLEDSGSKDERATETRTKALTRVAETLGQIDQAAQD